jgi:CRP-like cAMP-binding protein
MIAFGIDLSRQPFFAGLERRHLDKLVDCAQGRHFRPGEFIFREGEPAERFYIITGGSVVLETHPPQGEAVEVGTVSEWEALGWSWLFPPHRWHFDARAVTPVEVVVFDAALLRARCEEDHELGYELMKRVAGVVVQRLQAARFELVEARTKRSKFQVENPK